MSREVASVKDWCELTGVERCWLCADSILQELPTWRVVDEGERVLLHAACAEALDRQGEPFQQDREPNGGA